MTSDKRIIGYYINATAAHWETPQTRHGFRIFIRNPNPEKAQKAARAYMESQYPPYYILLYGDVEPCYE